MRQARLWNGKLIEHARWIVLEAEARRRYKLLPRANRPKREGRRLIKITCKECGGKVHANKIEGMPGFERAGTDITQGKKRNFKGVAASIARPFKKSSKWANHKKELGFDHDKFSAAVNCPSNFSDNIRFAAFYHRNEFNTDEQDANAKVILDPKIQAALKKVFVRLMLHLTNSVQEAEKALPDFELTQKRLMSLVGLRQRPFLIPYIAAIVADPRQRMLEGRKRPVDVVFVGNGAQVFDVTDIHGYHQQIAMPARLQARFAFGRGQSLWSVTELPIARDEALKLSKSYKRDVPALGDIGIMEEFLAQCKSCERVSTPADIGRRLRSSDRILRNHAIDRYSKYSETRAAELSLSVLAKLYGLANDFAEQRLKEPKNEGWLDNSKGYMKLRKLCADKSKEINALREDIIAGMDRVTAERSRPKLLGRRTGQDPNTKPMFSCG